MSNAGILYLVIFFTLLGAGFTHTIDSKICSGEDAKHDEAQAQITIAAENQVIKQVQQQDSITQGDVNAYHSNIASIDGLYASPGVRNTTSSAINSVHAIPTTTRGPEPVQCQITSKKYHLTPKQCDATKAGYIALWDDWKRKAAIK